MKTGPRQVPLVTVGRYLGPGRFEHGPVPDGPAADAERPRCRPERAWHEHARFLLQHEDLSAPRIDDGNGARSPGDRNGRSASASSPG